MSEQLQRAISLMNISFMWVPPKELRNGRAVEKVRTPRGVKAKPPEFGTSTGGLTSMIPKTFFPCRNDDSNACFRYDEDDAKAGATVNLCKAMASEDPSQLTEALQSDSADMAPAPLRMRAAATLRVLDAMHGRYATSLTEALEEAEAAGVQKVLLLKAERAEADSKFEATLAPGGDEAKRKALAQLESDRRMLLAELEELDDDDDGKDGKELLERWLVENHRKMLRLRLELHPDLALELHPPTRAVAVTSETSLPALEDKPYSEVLRELELERHQAEIERKSKTLGTDNEEVVEDSRWPDYKIPVGSYGVLTISIQSFIEHETVQAASKSVQNLLGMAPDRKSELATAMQDVDPMLLKDAEAERQRQAQLAAREAQLASEGNLNTKGEDDATVGKGAADAMVGKGEAENEGDAEAEVDDHEENRAVPITDPTKHSKWGVARAEKVLKRLGPSNAEWINKEHVHAAPPRPKKAAKSLLDSLYASPPQPQKASKNKADLALPPSTALPPPTAPPSSTALPPPD